MALPLGDVARTMCSLFAKLSNPDFLEPLIAADAHTTTPHITQQPLLITAPHEIAQPDAITIAKPSPSLVAAAGMNPNPIAADHDSNPNAVERFPHGVSSAGTGASLDSGTTGIASLPYFTQSNSMPMSAPLPLLLQVSTTGPRYNPPYIGSYYDGDTRLAHCYVVYSTWRSIGRNQVPFGFRQYGYYV